MSTDEQLNLVDMEESMTASSAKPSSADLLAESKPTAVLSLSTSHISLEDRTKLEEERERLYAALDAKVIEKKN